MLSMLKPAARGSAALGMVKVGGAVEIHLPSHSRSNIMSSINPVGGSNPVARTISKPAISKPENIDSPVPANRTDKLELSNVQSLLTQLKTNDIRVDKVAEIKAQIAAGTYETDDKLTAAADKLIDELA